MDAPEASQAHTVADAAAASADATVEAVNKAVEANDDPEVAKALGEAAAEAETTAGRVGWLRSWIHRLFKRD